MKHKGYNEKRQRIIEAADRIFHEKGFDDTSIDDILRDVKISRGTFYHYFSSKIELLDEIIKSFTDHFAEAFRKVVEKDNIDAVQKLNELFNVAETIKSREKSFMLQIIQVYFKEENLIYKKRMNDRFMTLLTPLYTKVFRQGKEEGTLDVIDPEETSYFFLQSFDAIRELNIMELISEKPDIDKILNRINMFLRYFERMMKLKEYSFPHVTGENFGELTDLRDHCK